MTSIDPNGIAIPRYYSLTVRGCDVKKNHEEDSSQSFCVTADFAGIYNLLGDTSGGESPLGGKPVTLLASLCYAVRLRRFTHIFTDFLFPFITHVVQTRWSNFKQQISYLNKALEIVIMALSLAPAILIDVCTFPLRLIGTIFSTAYQLCLGKTACTSAKNSTHLKLIEIFKRTKNSPTPEELERLKLIATCSSLKVTLQPPEGQGLFFKVPTRDFPAYLVHTKEVQLHPTMSGLQTVTLYDTNTEQ